MDTTLLPATPDGVAQAAALLKAGANVAFPTETVYGLGADATNGQAVAGIFAAKGRPDFNPLIVHVADVDQARNLTVWNDAADRLADAFWPGPLTLVLPLPRSSPLSPLVSAGQPSVAVRVPQHRCARNLLRASGVPIAAPSANPSGKISATTATHVMEGLGGRIAAILNDGPCSVGVESTIIGLTDTPRLLRPGGVAADVAENALGAQLSGAGDTITAPGQLSSHYAPNAAVRLNARTARDEEFHLGFGQVAGVLNLSASGDLQQAAANLFDYLHRANMSGLPIAVAPVPETGIGQAINDRLRRAAAPR